MLSFGRLCCMAAMAPALTDATAHSSSFKLPASPANPGQAPQTGVQPLLQDPSSPGLPNGRTDIHCQTAQIQTFKDTTAAAINLVRSAATAAESSINNNHVLKARITTSADTVTSKRQKRLCNGTNGITNNHQQSVPQINGHPRPRRVGQGQSSQKRELPVLRHLNGVSSGSQLNAGLNMNQQQNNSAGTSGMPNNGASISKTLKSEPVTMPPQTSPVSQTLHVSGDLQQGDKGTDPLASPSSISSLSSVSLGQNKLDLPSSSSLSLAQTSYDYNSGNNTSETTSIEFTEEQSESMAKQQTRLEQRARWLASRLRRLQTQEAKNHIQKQLSGIVGLHQTKWEVLRKQLPQKQLQEKQLQDPCQQCIKQRQETSTEMPKSPSPVCSSCNKPPTENPTDVFQRLTKVNDRILAQRILRGEDKDLYRDVKSVARKFSSTLSHGDLGADTDVTDESSGGESCDEGDDATSYDNRNPQRVPLHKRAIWKWATDRAAIASKWTWLQAQVSDLEYRIRQQSDIYRQIRATKGVVTLGEPLSPKEILSMRTLLTRTNRKLSPIEAKIARLEGRDGEASPSNLSTLLTNVDRQSARLKRSLQNCITPIGQVPPSSGSDTKLHAPKPMNGLVDNTAAGCVGGNPLRNSNNPSTPTTPTTDNKSIKSDALDTQSLLPPEELYCARTRPVKYYRKRKLLRTMAIHQTSRKAQKLTSVRCECCRPNNPCVLCGGKFNHVQKMDLDVMSTNERVAHVDHSFHPVLSLPQDIPLTVHFEALLKSGEWQRKPKQRTPKKYRLLNQSRLGYERRKDRSSRNKNRGRTQSRDRRDRLRQKDKSRKLLHKLAAQKFRELHARHPSRNDNKLSRSFSSPNSLPCTPKDKLSIEHELRQVQSEMKRRRSELNMAAMRNRERSNSLPNIGHFDLSDYTPSTPNADSKPPTPPFSQSMPGTSLQNLIRQQKKLSAADAYDIDNIVIPYSMLASTRVERLTYKEIMTPKWREVEDFDTGNEKINNTEDEEENLSDSEFGQRHNKCEITERQKFISLLAEQAWSNSRRGSRRSRNNSMGGTEPCSPDASLHETLASSINSSARSSPLPPAELPPPEPFARSSERRRASSIASETFSESADEHQHVAPIETWTIRTFPLDEDEVDELGDVDEKDDEIPIVEETVVEETAPLQDLDAVDGVPGMSTPESSDVEMPDDPNDPEWTVITLDKSKKIAPAAEEESPVPAKTTLVLKLAKR